VRVSGCQISRAPVGLVHLQLNRPVLQSSVCILVGSVLRQAFPSCTPGLRFVCISSSCAVLPPCFLVLLPSLLHFLVSQILLPALPFGTPVSWWFCAPVLSLLSFCLLHAQSDSLNLNPFFFASLVLQDICCFIFWLHSLGLWLHSLIFVCNL
jgi:hypothetical protein